MCGAKTLLGTATPSLESYANARAGKYGLVEINERFGQVCLPEIHVEDVKELRRKKMMTTPLAPQLISEIQAALASKPYFSKTAGDTRRSSNATHADGCRAANTAT